MSGCADGRHEQPKTSEVELRAVSVGKAVGGLGAAAGESVRRGCVCEWLSVCGDFFFFQAEDGIRYLTVTGVQTCALPICRALRLALVLHLAERAQAAGLDGCVASPREIRPLRTLLPRGWVIVTPGIRPAGEIGRASCRGRGEISVGAVSLKKKKEKQWGWG